MDQISDNQLIKQYLNGDKQSFEILVQRYLKEIYSFIFYYLRDRDEAEDITQEVFLKTWRQLKKFNLEKSFKTWLYTIAKNTTFDVLRQKQNEKNKKIVFNNDNLFLQEKNSNLLPEAILEDKKLKTTLDWAVTNLPLKYQEVIDLHINEDLKFREIADSLGESTNTVKSRYRRAVQALKQYFLN
ncbi:MAG: sigma-70 family RNA polymerase sigma factor [Candidatus Pacebacteria bacterium]|jgi:RNA polymerase sigma-70 factor (ECF subfamily)|nr:sigma-70 family RNA polymerase sigma factor [Candidatus Paceibacterota bacterium]